MTTIPKFLVVCCLSSSHIGGHARYAESLRSSECHVGGPRSGGDVSDPIREHVFPNIDAPIRRIANPTTGLAYANSALSDYSYNFIQLLAMWLPFNAPL